MQLKAGDTIVHPVYGLGNILTIEKKEFSEIGSCLYYKIALSRSNIWVPVETQEAIGIRPVTTRQELEQYRKFLRTQPDFVDTNLFGKDEEKSLSNRIKDGSFQTMCEIVQSLTVLGKQKPLGVSAKAILRKAQEKLNEEWAIAAGTSVEEANTEIAALLQEMH